MWDIDETRWYLFHFERDELEAWSLSTTGEILKTAAVVLFGLMVMVIM